MLKNNIRSIRFSDEMMEIINQQVGDNFNQKFERLVYNCYMVKDQRQKEIAQLDRELNIKRQQLKNTSARLAMLECLMRETAEEMKSVQNSVSRMREI